MALTEDHVREELKKVIDPELFVNIVDLGLIYDVNFEPNEEDDSKQDVKIDMTMTSPMCPAGPQLIANSKQVVSAIEEVAEVEVKIVMDPPWTPDCMTEDAGISWVSSKRRIFWMRVYLYEMVSGGGGYCQPIRRGYRHCRHQRLP